MDLMVQNLESHVDGTVGLFASPIYRKKLRVKEAEWKELNDEIAVNLKLGGGGFKIFLEFSPLFAHKNKESQQKILIWVVTTQSIFYFHPELCGNDGTI